MQLKTDARHSEILNVRLCANSRQKVRRRKLVRGAALVANRKDVGPRSFMGMPTGNVRIQRFQAMYTSRGDELVQRPVHRYRRHVPVGSHRRQHIVG